jgi:hypothetical protein
MPVRPSINNINIENKENLIELAQNFESKNLDMKLNEEEKEKFPQKKKNEETNPSGSIPPPLEHVKIYFDEKNFPAVEAEKFFNYFESNGWLVGGRAKMKDWKAAACNWMLNCQKFIAPQGLPKPNPKPSPNGKNYSEPL